MLPVARTPSVALLWTRRSGRNRRRAALLRRYFSPSWVRMSTERSARAWLEVQASALRSNLATLVGGLAPGTGVIPMVKADGYGLGMLNAVRALEAADPLAYGVATVEEGLRLRSAGCGRRILVCSPVPPDSVERAVEAGLELSVSDLATLARLRKAGDGAAMHVEVDTGMGRAGFDWRRVGEWGPAVEEAAGAVRWAGIFTHFHSADQAGERVCRAAVAAMAGHAGLAPHPRTRLPPARLQQRRIAPRSPLLVGRRASGDLPLRWTRGRGASPPGVCGNPSGEGRARKGRTTGIHVGIRGHASGDRLGALGDRGDRIRGWVAARARQSWARAGPGAPGPDRRTDLHGRHGGRHDRRGRGGPR